MCGNILFHSPLASSWGIHRKLWRQSQEKPSDRINKKPAKHLNFKIPEETSTEIHPIQTDTKEGLPNKRRRRNPKSLAISREIHNDDSINELNYRLTMIHTIHHPVDIKKQGEKLVESFKIPERNQNWYTSPTERKAIWKPFLQIGSKQKSG